MIFVVRASLLKDLLQHGEWKARLEKAKGWSQVLMVVEEFARSHGYKVKWWRNEQAKGGF